MNNNILNLGYEALLQPSKKATVCGTCPAGQSEKELYAAQVKFFGLDRIFQFSQKVK